MSLSNILLGLIDQPKSGYEIKQTFETVLRYFWNSDLAQIYPTLKKLESAGLATSQMAHSSKGPSKKVYQRTTEGSQEFHRWLLNGPQVNNEKLQYLTQVFFLDEIPLDKRIQFFESLQAYFQHQLDELICVQQNWEVEDSRYPDNLPAKEQAIEFTLRLGLVKIRAIVDWCDSCLITLKK